MIDVIKLGLTDILFYQPDLWYKSAILFQYKSSTSGLNQNLGQMRSYCISLGMSYRSPLQCHVVNKNPMCGSVVMIISNVLVIGAQRNTAKMKPQNTDKTYVIKDTTQLIK